MTPEEKNTITEALMESIWIMRWNKNKTGLTAVLQVGEALSIVNSIFKNLEDSGFEITKK